MDEMQNLTRKFRLVEPKTESSHVLKAWKDQNQIPWDSIGDQEVYYLILNFGEQ